MRAPIDYNVEAHKVFRRIQLKYGHTFTPAYTTFVGRAYGEAKAKDETGLQAYRFALDIEEQCALMPQR
jgi:hypothetical protein